MADLHAFAVAGEFNIDVSYENEEANPDLLSWLEEADDDQSLKKAIRPASTILSVFDRFCKLIGQIGSPEHMSTMRFRPGTSIDLPTTMLEVRRSRSVAKQKERATGTTRDTC